MTVSSCTRCRILASDLSFKTQNSAFKFKTANFSLLISSSLTSIEAMKLTTISSPIHVIQWMPYYPPHRGWLETHAQEFAQHYLQAQYGQVITLTSSVGQWNWQARHTDDLIRTDKGKVIWYRLEWEQILILPSFDIISGFPVLKLWHPRYRSIMRYLRTQRKLRSQDKIIIQTRARFFITTRLGWCYSRRHRLKWVHSEHGSDFVKHKQKFVETIAHFCDKTFGRWIFRKADALVAVSQWVQDFVHQAFVTRPMTVIYRGMDFNPLPRIKHQGIIIGFVGRIVALKWVSLLLESFKQLRNQRDDIQLWIIGDGYQRQELENLEIEGVKFYWSVDRAQIATYLASIDILVNPSYQEWLPTSILEWLLAQCVVLASDAGWSREASPYDDLVIVPVGDQDALTASLEQLLVSYKDLSWLSYDHVRSTFDWKYSIQIYCDLYQNLYMS